MTSSRGPADVAKPARFVYVPQRNWHRDERPPAEIEPRGKSDLEKWEERQSFTGATPASTSWLRASTGRGDEAT